MDFDQLPLIFEGDSRILRQTSTENILACKLKPTLFSIEKKGPVIAIGIDRIRTRLNALLCELLHQKGVRTSTLATMEDLILLEKQEVAPIEVVVKAALVGSPKHLYKNIANTPSRLPLSQRHSPYVRFDWRNPLPLEDQCMPIDLADYFIDTKQASSTALKAFAILQEYLAKKGLELLDICFFMNTAGTVICAEVSTDNCRIVSPHLPKDKLQMAQAILDLLEAP